VNESVRAIGAARWVWCWAQLPVQCGHRARVRPRGFDVLGVHLDRKQGLKDVEALLGEIESWAAAIHQQERSRRRRALVIDEFSRVLDGADPCRPARSRSAAGLLRRRPHAEGASRGNRDDVDDGQQSCTGAGLMQRGPRHGRAGLRDDLERSHTAWVVRPVSAAKAALEAHVRQLCGAGAPGHHQRGARR
jgi:hypothetical protein